MKLNLGSKVTKALSLAVLAAAAAASGVSAEGQVLMSGDPSLFGHSYGRAGGVVGADLISTVGQRGSVRQVSVTYDKGIAARTNMSVDRPEGGSIAITQDEGVRSRTNMGAGFEDKKPAQTTAKVQK